MNENVWDPVLAWQALLPGSVTECPEKLPEINLLVPEFLTATALPWPGVTATPGLWPRPEKLVSVASHTGTLVTKLLEDTAGLTVSAFLIHLPSLSVNQGKVKSAALPSGVLPSAIFQGQLTMDTCPVEAHLWGPGMEIMLCDFRECVCVCVCVCVREREREREGGGGGPWLLGQTPPSLGLSFLFLFFFFNIFY
uniref:Uncharacterized protein n=1 Tax=Pipistrellus kuhlii TaxID=59472 RepID=A0A7J7VBB2_PIPKU|nr:hypothetical protein mPipKuh1_008468 [Pipistrellus kuhlii]